MGHDYDQRGDVVTSAPRSDEAPTTPGKRTRTQAYRDRSLKHGCEREELDLPASECMLSVDERTRLQGRLGAVVQSSMLNFSIALHRARLEIVTAKPEAWGAFTEFLFYSVTGPLIGGALQAFRAVRAAAQSKPSNVGFADIFRGEEPERQRSFARAVTSISDENVSALLQNSSRSLRRHMMQSAGRKARDQATMRADFLAILEEQLKPMADGIILDAPGVLSDAGLWALVESYRDDGEVKAHSVAAYEARVQDYLARYQSQDVIYAGREFPDGGLGRPVVLEAYGQRRHAMLSDHASGDRAFPPPGEGLDVLVSFVDDDLAAAAAAQYQARVPGGVVETIQVTKRMADERSEPTLEKEVPHWAEAAARARPFQFDSAAVQEQFRAWVLAAERRTHKPRVGAIPPAELIAHEVEGAAEEATEAVMSWL